MRTTVFGYRSGWLGLLLLFCVSAMGQTESNMNPLYKVAVGDIQYTPKTKKETVGSVLGNLAQAAVTGQTSEQQDSYADAVRAAIVSGLSRVRRFRVIEGEFMPGEVADDETAFYLDGTIGSISTTQKTVTPEDKQKKPYNMYKGQVSAILNLKDIHTDEVVVVGNFNISDSDCSWLETAEGALNNAISTLTRRVTRHFNARFPLQAKVVERGEAKKDKQKELFLNIGSAAGAYEKQRYELYVVSIIAGKEARHNVGTVRIDEVLGDEICRCHVSSGSKDIKTALDNGKELIAVSTE